MDVVALKKDLIRDEGAMSKPYIDTNRKTTIGVGRNLTDKGLSPGEVDMLLTNDINEVIASLDMALPCWKTLSEARQRALANMCFNMGLHGLLGFSGMLNAVRSGDFTTAAAAALDSAWAKQVGSRAQRIAALIATG